MVLRERGLADEEEGKGFFDKGLYRKLPLPSNAMLLNTDLETGKNFLFIPVLDQPLSSNRYYVIHAEGKYKGCTQHGCATDALNLFGLMKECGIKPNHITSVGVLSACSYGGLVEEGLKVYKDTVTGNHAAMKVIELEPQESASYVPHNIYAGAVVEPLAASVRELMQQ
ncbi:hypothetical protein V6N12_003471 [Hibiscus sabdariffa]|uniref:Uncharacterized protein n=1 Tax=Hibiscus sabdariffa TaxID=183260 RepID=A0ABR2AHA3_9ROSI